MTEYVTKDSGERQNFDSGARRDISTGKTRPDLISVKAIRRWADLMARGAEKYGSRNWELGMPVSRFQESAERHLLNYKEGDREEDHLAAILFNIGAMIHFEGTEWDDVNAPEYVEWTLEVEPQGHFTKATKAAMDDFWLKLDAGLFDDLLDYDGTVDLDDDNLETWDQQELQPADETEDLINWEKLRKDVAEGKLDGDTVNWAPGQAPE